jgi:hypothetical protein
MTQSDLQSLFTHPERAHRSILSVYLNVDQSQQSNQNREFEKALKSMMLSMRSTIHDTTESEKFATAARHIEDFVSAYEPGSPGLAIFFDCVDGFFWHQELGIPIQNQIRWERELFTQPLANALDQFGRYGVVLADRVRLRLFIVFHGAIEEFTREGLTTNTRMQQFIKEVDWLVQNKHAHHLVLAGAADVTSELRGLLPKRLALRIIGTANVSIDTATSELLTATLKLAEDYARNT